MITYDEFKKVEMRVGEILSAERVPETDKLLKLAVNLGDPPIGGSPRQIISGIAAYFPDPQVLIGKKCAFVANLEPRVIRGLESQGMIMAVGGHDLPFSLLEVSVDIPPGSLVK